MSFNLYHEPINRKLLLILVLIFLLFLLHQGFLSLIPLIKITILIGTSNNNKKYWVGEKYKITLIKFPANSDEKIYLRNTDNKRTKLFKENILMNSSGRECLIAYTKKVNSTKCFNIYNTPELYFKENNPVKIEVNHTKSLNLDSKDYPKIYIKYHSNHPEIIKINDEGIITAIRPGSAIVTASGLDDQIAKIKILSVSEEGLINNSTLDIYNASQYKNVMIVAHPDDETLWGGANLINDRYFVVCLTNGYTLSRANDFREILKFTNNSGIILNYPDVQDNIRDNWSEVERGILKDLSTIINYNFWEKIVTHGPDGTTGHFHHKKTCEYLTKITKKYNKYNNLYYFGKFYKKNSIPKYLKRISNRELKYKKKEVSIYKSVKKIIFKLWYHMLPYENFVLASEWKNI